jgi:hypothetical protein
MRVIEFELMDWERGVTFPAESGGWRIISGGSH